MRVLLENPYNHRRYKIEPHDNGECFKLYVSPLPGAINKQGEPVKAEWLFTGKYPRTIEHGLDTAYQHMLMDTEDDREVDLSELVATLRKMRREVSKTITMD